MRSIPVALPLSRQVLCFMAGVTPIKLDDGGPLLKRINVGKGIAHEFVASGR